MSRPRPSRPPRKPGPKARAGRPDRTRARRPASRGTDPPAKSGFAALSQRPLYVLAFLAPLLVFYEFGSIFLLSGGAEGVSIQLRAHQVMGVVFESLGVASVHIPALVIVVVLLSWHILRKDPWKIRPGVLGGMAGESLLWTMPLLALSLVLFSPGSLGVLSGMGAAARDGGTLWDLPWVSRLLISIGAGLYEETLFRLILINLLHALIVDLLGFADRAGKVAAVLLSAVAFAAIHEPVSGPDAWSLRSYYFLTGIFFGVLFVQRGLGIAVGAHAIYDAIALLAPAGSGG